MWMWDEVWKAGLSGKTVWMKGLLAKTCRMMMVLIMMVFLTCGTDVLGLWRRVRPADSAEFLPASGCPGAVSDSPAARPAACPPSREALGKRYSSVCCGRFVGKGWTPRSALVQRWSNHNLFSLGPNWSPDGLISRVRHYRRQSLLPCSLPPVAPPPPPLLLSSLVK